MDSLTSDGSVETYYIRYNTVMQPFDLCCGVGEKEIQRNYGQLKIA